MTRARRAAGWAAALAVAGCGAGASAPAPALLGGFPLRRVVDVPLPGGSTRFDYADVDAGRRLLVVSHMGDGSVLAFDLRRRRPLRVMRGAPSVRGVLVLPARQRIFAAAAGADAVIVFDELTGRRVGRVSTAAGPDGLAYAPAPGRIFVSAEQGRAETVIDARTLRRVGNVALGGEAGNVRYDATAGQILVAEQTHDALVRIDPRSMRRLGRIALPGCDSAHSLLVDAPRRRAFVACEANRRLLTVDLARGGVVGTAQVGDTPDVLALDARRRRLYVAAESGVVTVLDVSGARARVIGRRFLARAAHTVAVDPVSGHVLFALESVNGRPVMRVMRPTG